MTVQAEISLYALGELDLLPIIEDFLGKLREQGLKPQMGTMSTVVLGDSTTVFSAMATAFDSVARDRRCILFAKYSNACPVPKEESE